MERIGQICIHSEEGWRRCRGLERGRLTRFPAEETRWTGELFLRRERAEEKDISVSVEVGEGEVVVSYELFPVEYLKGDKQVVLDEPGTHHRRPS